MVIEKAFSVDNTSFRWWPGWETWDCRRVLPTLERCYGQLNIELTNNLNDQGSDALDNDFALQEFLDRYGMRLAQLGTILNLVGLLADAGTPGEAS